MEQKFSRWKQQSLNKLDQSKKGNLDRDIQHLVSLINSCQEYFTTSSCSGRIILIDGDSDSSKVQKLNCVWLFVSHEKCSSDDLMFSLQESRGDAVLKFEPLVLHVQCRKLEDAQRMLSVAVASGFRNSGITVGKTGKIMAAVRCSNSLEVPLSRRGTLLVQPEYLDFLTQKANQKMEENLRRIQRFYQNLQSVLSDKLQQLQTPEVPPSQKPQDPPQGPETEVYRRRRKRGQHQTDGCHGDVDNSITQHQTDGCHGDVDNSVTQHQTDGCHGDVDNSVTQRQTDSCHGDVDNSVTQLDDCLDLFL